MVEFIELTRNDGVKVLVGIEHIVKVVPENDGAVVFFDFAAGGSGSYIQERLHVKETMAIVKRKLGL